MNRAESLKPIVHLVDEVHIKDHIKVIVYAGENKGRNKSKGQSRMNNPEIQVTLSIRQSTQTSKIKNTTQHNTET